MLGQKLRERFDGLVDRLFLNLTYEAKKIDWPHLIRTGSVAEEAPCLSTISRVSRKICTGGLPCL